MTVQHDDSDVVDHVENRIIKNFNFRRVQRFEKLGTKPTDWKPCRALDTEYDDCGKEVVVYDKPVGYVFVTPFYDELTPEKRAELDEKHSQNMENCEGSINNCQICGKEIWELCPIQHDEKKFVMIVGNECIKNYVDATYNTKTIKIFKTNTFREEFKRCIPKLQRQIFNDIRCHQVDKHGNTKTYSKDGRNIPMLKNEYFKFNKEIYMISNKLGEISQKKMLGILRRAKRLELEIPEKLEKHITKTK
jgi:hypothetical protein